MNIGLGLPISDPASLLGAGRGVRMPLSSPHSGCSTVSSMTTPNR